MNYSNIKELKNFCDNLTSTPCYREVLEKLSEDFEVGNVRFISDNSILSVMVDEIFNGDDYILGCFNASFIAENSSLHYALVKTCQESEAFEAIGEALNETMSQDEKESFCEEYASADGYGHHFNHYDGNCEEITIDGVLYHVFDNR